MIEEPPAVRSVSYVIVPTGVWLSMMPTSSKPVTIFVPNRMLAGLSRVFSGRVAFLAAGQREGEDRDA